MFVVLMALLLVGWAVHLLRSGPRTRARGGHLLLLYLLIGYCGIPMLLVGGLLLIHPHEMAHVLGVEPDHPYALFLGWAYLGMATVATLALRFRGSYLVAPAVLWAVFFAGATFVHIDQDVAMATGHLGLLQIFAAHGLISVLLLGGLWASGLWRAELTPAAAPPSRPQ